MATYTRVDRRQLGITMIGLLFSAVFVASAALVVLKVFPAVSEYRTVLSVVNKIAESGGSTVPEIRSAFDRAVSVEYGVTSVRSQDLEVTKEDEKVVIRFAYDKEIALIEPVYLLIKFKGRSH